MNKESFGEGPQVEEDTKNIELPLEAKEAVETVAERTADLIEGETEVAVEVARKRKKSSFVRKATRTFTLLSLLMGAGGMVNKAESQDFWEKGRTTGGVIADIGIQVGGEIIRDRLDQSARKEQEKIRELENELPKLKEELGAKKEQLVAFRAQEKAGANMTEWINKLMAEIGNLEEEIAAKEKDLEDLRGGNLLRDGTGVVVDEITNRGPAGWRRGGGFWGRK